MLVEIQVMLSFLFGKNKLESMEKHYTNEEYAKMIYQLYPPHKDNVGYKSRISDMRENLSEVLQVYKKDEILTESEQMNLVKRVMQLSVDCLRFYMYAENKILEQREGEGACQISQVEYSCAVTPPVRQTGNRLSRPTETACASLLA